MTRIAASGTSNTGSSVSATWITTHAATM